MQVSQAGFPAPVIVSSTDDLAQLCARLKQEPFVTIDTEFVREHTYWPQLCVVQLGGMADVAVIDTLASGLDLAPLADLLATESCVKVFHAARQDLEIFLHLFDVLPRSIFDTQVAAMVGGYGDQVGYDTLVSAITGAGIDKTHRFSDWAARPLSKAQIAYAAADVTHLRNVYLTLHDELVKQNRLHWADAELAVLNDPATFRPDPRRQWERLKARTNNRRMLGVLREVAAWREIEAQALDIPRQRLIRDEVCLRLRLFARRMLRPCHACVGFLVVLLRARRRRACLRRSRLVTIFLKRICPVRRANRKAPNLHRRLWRCSRLFWRRAARPIA